MSLFTLDYLARLETWALMAVVLQGGLVWLSWSAWARSARASAAAVRHRLACLHFAALAVLPLLTLAGLQWSVAGMVYAGCRCARAASEPAPLLAGYRQLLALSGPAALVWAAGSAVAAARLVFALLRLGRLETRPARAEAADVVRRLAARWRGCPVVSVREAEVEAPQVIGLLRPTLLLPRRFDARLGPAEQEAVFLHELAHAARGDFGWNLVQRLVLAVLWFHPAAWLLYGRLCSEREIRCDALAVRQGASAGGLARALVRLAEGRSAGRLAMALSSGAELSLRLRRLLEPGASRPAGAWIPLTAAALASALCLLTLGAGRFAGGDPSIRDAFVASAFGPTIAIEARDRAGRFSVNIRQGRVISASVGERPLAPAQIVQRGGRVVLIGEARQPVVALTVSPAGQVSWAARR
jgi:Zn-dependent protease with chaperone function